MMNGSSHDWKFTAISRYTSTTAKINPEAKPEERRLHRLVLAPQGQRRPTRQARLLVPHDLLDFRTDAAQIAPIDVGVDIEDRGHVVVIDYDRTVAAFHVHQIRQKLSRTAGHRTRVAVGLRDAARRGPTEALPAAAAPASEPGVVSDTALVAGGHRRPQQVIERVDSILRCLHADVVADTRRVFSQKLGAT